MMESTLRRFLRTFVTKIPSIKVEAAVKGSLHFVRLHLAQTNAGVPIWHRWLISQRCHMIVCSGARAPDQTIYQSGGCKPNTASTLDACICLYQNLVLDQMQASTL